MTFEQALQDFMIFKVIRPKKNKKGKYIPEEIENDKWKNIPLETQGKKAICDANDYGFMPQERLCFVIKEGELELL